MFINHCTYRHRRTLDVDIYVNKVSYRGPEYTKLRVTYINRHNGIVYNTQPQTVKIYRKDFDKWNRVVS